MCSKETGFLVTNTVCVFSSKSFEHSVSPSQRPVDGHHLLLCGEAPPNNERRSIPFSKFETLLKFFAL